MVDRYAGGKKTIFIVDRGYESYNNIAHVIEKDAFFLFRCKDMNSSGILSGSQNKLPSTEIFDTTLSLILTRKWTKEVLEHPEKYRRFRNKDSFDFLDLDEHAYYNMNLTVQFYQNNNETYILVLLKKLLEQHQYKPVTNSNNKKQYNPLDK